MVSHYSINWVVLYEPPSLKNPLRPPVSRSRQEHPDLVVGIDICGDPHQPTVTPYLLPALKVARKSWRDGGEPSIFGGNLGRYINNMLTCWKWIVIFYGIWRGDRWIYLLVMKQSYWKSLGFIGKSPNSIRHFHSFCIAFHTAMFNCQRVNHQNAARQLIVWNLNAVCWRLSRVETDFGKVSSRLICWIKRQTHSSTVHSWKNNRCNSRQIIQWIGLVGTIWTENPYYWW